MFSETIELLGHIIDSLILPKVLDQILSRGAQFKINEVKIGGHRADQSFARIDATAADCGQNADRVFSVRSLVAAREPACYRITSIPSTPK